MSLSPRIASSSLQRCVECSLGTRCFIAHRHLSKSPMTRRAQSPSRAPDERRQHEQKLQQDFLRMKLLNQPNALDFLKENENARPTFERSQSYISPPSPTLAMKLQQQRRRAPPLELTADSFAALLNDIDTFVFDADGVLWLGDDVMPGSPAMIDFLIKKKKRVIVLTNNATKSRATYAKKLHKLGYPLAIAKENIVNPAAVVADVLSRKGLRTSKKKVYMIGAQGVRDELDEVGEEYFGHGPEPVDHSDGSAFIFDIQLEQPAEKVGAVVVGYEKHFNYHKLMKAANYLQEKDCLFLATNEDETCPGPNPNVVIPDAGPLVAAVRVASGREPLTVGKPNSPSFEYICRRWRVEPARTIMVGDRTNTDVKFGRDHGLKTLLVLSGCHQLEDVETNILDGRDDMVPDYIASCLGAIVPNRSAA